MVSVFVAARRLGLDPAAAYLVQAVIAVPVIIVVALAWFRDAPAAARYALLVLGTWLVTPYLQDYDLVIGAFVVLWLRELYPDLPQAGAHLGGTDPDLAVRCRGACQSHRLRVRTAVHRAGVYSRGTHGVIAAALSYRIARTASASAFALVTGNEQRSPTQTNAAGPLAAFIFSCAGCEAGSPDEARNTMRSR